jgi:hypothetical protein
MTGAVCFAAIEPPDPTSLARSALYWQLSIAGCATCAIATIIRRTQPSPINDNTGKTKPR